MLAGAGGADETAPTNVEAADATSTREAEGTAPARRDERVIDCAATACGMFLTS